jgi:23S rRNA pseudouridine2604 synthase
MGQEGTQINKYISSSGFCSRREADRLIEQGRVTLNGKLALPTSRVGDNDKVAIDDETLRIKKKEPFYIAFNKPKGITSTTDIQDKSNIVSFINHNRRIFPVGRLDKDSEGLILLTDDGDIVNKILRVENGHEKEYLVSVNKPIVGEFVNKMSSGIPILDTVTKPCKVKLEGSKKFRITLTQGLNRQIRRMCEYMGYEVSSLKRVRIMHIMLADLAVGKFRKLSPLELVKLNEAIDTSVSTSSSEKKPAKARKKPFADKKPFTDKDKRDFAPGPRKNIQGTKPAVTGKPPKGDFKKDGKPAGSKFGRSSKPESAGKRQKPEIPGRKEIPGHKKNLKTPAKPSSRRSFDDKKKPRR